MKRYFTLCLCLISFLTYSQSDSALIVSLKRKKQIFSKQLTAIQDSIKLLDKQIITLESNMLLAKYENENSLMAAVRPDNKVRKKSGPMGEVIATIPSNIMVELLDYESNDYWLIKSGNVVGYVSSVFILYNDEITDFKNALVKRNKIRQEDQIKKQRAEFIENVRLENAQNAAEYEKSIAERIEREKLQAAQLKAAQEKRKKGLIVKYGESIGNKIYNGYYWIGMKDSMAKESLGNPEDINRTVGSWGVHEQWVYGSTYLYFENGILTSYQN